MNEQHQLLFGAGTILVLWLLGVSLSSIHHAFSPDPEGGDKVDYLLFGLVILGLSMLGGFVLLASLDNMMDGLL